MALRVALGRFNARVSNMTSNVVQMRHFSAKGIETGAELVIFSEMATCVYPPKDLLLKKHFFEDNMQAVGQMARDCSEMTVIVGFAEMDGK